MPSVLSVKESSSNELALVAMHCRNFCKKRWEREREREERERGRRERGGGEREGEGGEREGRRREREREKKGGERVGIIKASSHTTTMFRQDKAEHTQAVHA